MAIFGSSYNFTLLEFCNSLQTYFFFLNNKRPTYSPFMEDMPRLFFRYLGSYALKSVDGGVKKS